jgi:hypothetical protein
LFLEGRRQTLGGEGRETDVVFDSHRPLHFPFVFNTPTAKKASIQTRTFLTPSFPQIAVSLTVVASGMFC